MIVVVGGGTMGAGIATSFLSAGESVTLIESAPEFAETAATSVAESLERMARKADIDVGSCLDRFEVRTDHGTASAELVIEAIPEQLPLKQELFRSLAAQYPSTTLFATNTSSLSVTEMAEVLDDPGRFIGMHFFNPVPVSSLVEIVVGAETTDETVAAIRSRVESLGKTPIVVRDAPGFASSRLGLALGLEAIRMLEAGVASAADIDTAMELGYRHPMGPLRLTDLIGLDVRLAIAEHLAGELGPRFEPPALLRGMVAEGRLGKKSGRGFYEW